MSNDVTLETLAQRLIALEHQNRRLKRAFAGVLVGAFVILALVGTKAQVTATTVAADRLSMVDAQGRTRATIENSPTPQGNPLLTFFDRTGNPRLRIGLGARGGPTLETIDENGKAKDLFGPPYARPLTQ
jgi:hypothetical protein